MWRIWGTGMVLLCALMLISCGSADTMPAAEKEAGQEASAKPEIKAENLPVSEDPVFGYIVVDIEGEDMAKLGFELGDSLDLSFSNGLVKEDVPYHDGYYVRIGDVVTVAYPGIPGINVALNLGNGSWEEFGLSEGDTVTIVLHEKGKYTVNQELFSQKHSDDPSDFDSLETFCNFRSLSGGTLKEGVIYRSASMTNNSTNRAHYVDELIAEYGINQIMDLSDTENSLAESRAKDDWASSNFDALYEKGNVQIVGLSVKPTSLEFCQKLCSSIYEMIQNKGPYLINCTEGKDRTGYAATLIEALCGASYEELRADYLKTYSDFYNISEETDPERVAAIMETSFDPIVEAMFCTEAGDDIHTIDYAEKARQFFLRGGLTEEQIDEILSVITE